MMRSFCTSDQAARSGPVETIDSLRRLLADTAPRPGGTRQPGIATGIASIDGALRGGLPKGVLVEISGRASRMACALAALARATQAGILSAFIDAPDALDPRAAAEAGVDLRRVLWARLRGPERARDGLRAADMLVAQDGFGLVVLYLCGVTPPRRMDHAWQRLGLRCRRSGATLLVATDRPLSGSANVAALSLRPQRSEWRRAPGGRAVLAGQSVQIEVLHGRAAPAGMTGLAFVGR
jgi:hypothetical protein